MRSCKYCVMECCCLTQSPIWLELHLSVLHFNLCWVNILGENVKSWNLDMYILLLYSRGWFKWCYLCCCPSHLYIITCQILLLSEYINSRIMTRTTAKSLVSYLWLSTIYSDDSRILHVGYTNDSDNSTGSIIWITPVILANLSAWQKCIHNGKGWWFINLISGTPVAHWNLISLR